MASLGELEEGQDWTQLASFAIKRGSKSFEPILDGARPSEYDHDALQYQRNIMYHALSQPRGFLSTPEKLTHSTIIIGSECYIDTPRGKYLETMGKIDKSGRCHLTFEEAVYLIERGTCIAKHGPDQPILSLQQVYGDLIRSAQQLDQLLVYSTLKRNGYIVMKKDQSELENTDNPSPRGVFSTILSLINGFAFKFFPFRSIFAFLHGLLTPKRIEPAKNSQLVPIYNVWKPTKGFRKSSPPPPHYQLAFVRASSAFPDIRDLKARFSESTPLLVAVADNGIVNFYTLSETKFDNIGIVWKDSWSKKWTLPYIFRLFQK
ncbi:hypothetical protein OGAPHI_001409 [Ogataea philodendri]|uniref:tRNA-splicing endonuclease subunit Sen54 N-terminal domain-containing protein n=1 Tax=Ogataea philodendri TaxID=1378263 RepID=A0A9P8T7K7_9ASCO|nr:uncharacterized protein OGAPHI_001409 [Ogataea philodendri]KAH3669288.1 hypothetical protein OGAPHI_001409 [Ogataea philodendri]